MDADSNSDSLHIVMFPWLAFGHMHPFLELAKSLATRGHRITFISTPRNIQRLPSIPSHLSSLITFVPLTLPHVEPLPENAESTSDISRGLMPYLRKAFDGLSTPFSAFLKSACSDRKTKPDWIIMDVHHHWLPKIAQEFCVSCALFYVIPASSLVFFGPYSPEVGTLRTTIADFTVPPSWIPFPSNLAFRPHEARLIAMGTQENESGLSIVQRVSLTFFGSKFVCVRSCFELESKWLSLLAELFKKDVVPVGLLAPPAEKINSAGESLGGEHEFDVIDWLNKHSPKSVLYIALGSEAALSTELLHELAFGLERSGVPFLSALRKPAGMIGGAATDILPASFEERIKGSGHVEWGWVPQMRILAHASVGGFLTHCGPSSVIESLQFGHPLIMLPLIIDQGLIARVLEERGVGVEVPRDAETGDFDQEGVAKVVRFVMVEEDGKLIRHNAEKIQPIFTDKISQERHLDGFIKHLEKYRST
ncbi:Glycosyltransferase [Rhynchospora pubera]|uniref:Glycosyltransferase n=1 Tax=Rhynchospora pubera TaxID=906938 RepID=A0AAV8CC76_9POAL|nr:Glycosyltransferase [Rhynchospora pubera]